MFSGTEVQSLYYLQFNISEKIINKYSAYEDPSKLDSRIGIGVDGVALVEEFAELHWGSGSFGTLRRTPVRTVNGKANLTLNLTTFGQV